MVRHRKQRQQVHCYHLHRKVMKPHHNQQEMKGTAELDCLLCCAEQYFSHVHGSTYDGAIDSAQDDSHVELFEANARHLTFSIKEIFLNPVPWL